MSQPAPSRPPASQPPRGLVLFPPGTPRAVRRRRLVFVALCLPALATLMWPVFAWLAGPFPLVFGLPLPMAWVVAVVLWVFLALWWLDRGDRPADRSDREG